jgi:hypothetical protein
LMQEARFTMLQSHVASMLPWHWALEQLAHRCTPADDSK